MNALHYLASLLLVFGFFGCNQDDDTSVVEYVIDNGIALETNDISDFFWKKSISLSSELELELSGMMRSFAYYDDILFLFDPYRSNALLAVSNEGQIIFTLNPKEDPKIPFSTISDIHFNEEHREMAIFDESISKIIFYDFGGAFLREEPLYFYFCDAVFLDSGDVLYDVSPVQTEQDKYSQKKIGLIRENRADTYTYEVVRNNLLYIKDKRKYTNYTNFQSYQGEVFYHQDFTDTVYRYQDTLTPMFTFRFAVNDYRDQILREGRNPSVLQELIDENVPFTTWIAPLGDKVALSYGYDMAYRFALLESGNGHQLVNGNSFYHEGTYLQGVLMHHDGVLLNQEYEGNYELLQEYRGDLPDHLETDSGPMRYTLLIPKE